MKLLFDHQAFTMQRYGGVSRYFTELFKKITLPFELSLFFSDNIYLKELQYQSKFRRLPAIKGKSTLLNWINIPSSINKLRKGDFDLFHPTYYNPYFINYLGSRKYILTVHDMTHELFPDKVSSMDKTAEYKRVVVRKASKIICVSQNTRNDLCRILNIEESKTEVIYHGSSIKLSQQQSSINLPENFILYVGTRGYYKNFNLLYKAVQPLLKEDKSLYLICAGGGGFKKNELQRFQEAGLTSRILYKEPSNILLPVLYNRARVFIFPSLYEGFGLPILEAFNCDCPVISSNVGSLPEVGGDAVYYFDPHDAEMLREAVDKIIYDHDIRKYFIQKGRIRRTLFSWEKTTQQTMDLYKSVF